MPSGLLSSVSPPKRTGGSTPLVNDVYSAPLGTSSFVAPRTGDYTFEAIGGGGSGNAQANSGSLRSGGSGAYARKTVRMVAGDVAQLVVGIGADKSVGGGTSGTDGVASTVTFPDGAVMTAGGGPSGSTATVGAIATGGDLNVTGAVLGLNVVGTPKLSFTGSMPRGTGGGGHWVNGGGGATVGNTDYGNDGGILVTYQRQSTAIIGLPKIGDALGGGYVAGFGQAQGVPYAIIIAPKAATSAALVWKSVASADTGLLPDDGYANTYNVMAGTSYPAAVHARTYGSDWYLPTMAELMAFHRASTALPSGEGHTAGVATNFWSSEESAASTTSAQILSVNTAGVASYANGGKASANGVVRPVRRHLLV